MAMGSEAITRRCVRVLRDGGTSRPRRELIISWWVCQPDPSSCEAGRLQPRKWWCRKTCKLEYESVGTTPRLTAPE